MGRARSSRRSRWPTKASSSTRRCRRASPKAGSSSRSSPRPRRSTCPAARCRGPAIASSTRTTPTRCARSPRTAPTRSIAARSRARSPPTCDEQRRHHRASPISRSTARSSASRSSGSIAATRSMPAVRRCRPAFSCSSRCRFSRTTSRAPGARTTTDADYFHYVLEVVEGARSGAPRRRPRALAGRLRRASDARARARSCSRRSIRKKASRYERQPPEDAPVGAAAAHRRRARRRLPSPMPTAT